MLMYAAILVLIIAVAILGYCLRHVQAVNVQLKHAIKGRDLELVLEKADRQRFLNERDDLRWQLNSSSFMLNVVMNELPEGHVFEIPSFEADKRKERVEEHLKQIDETFDHLFEKYTDYEHVGAQVLSTGPIPEQRSGNGEARFKDSA